jgi:hypothetical protein
MTQMGENFPYLVTLKIISRLPEFNYKWRINWKSLPPKPVLCGLR